MRYLLLLLAALTVAEPASAIPILNQASSGSYIEAGDDALFDDGQTPNSGTPIPNGFSLFTNADGSAKRGAVEFGIQSAPRWKSATLTFVTGLTLLTSSYAGDVVPLEVHGFWGDGQVTRTDVLYDNLLSEIFIPETIPSQGDSWLNWSIDVTEFLQDTQAEHRSFIGFSFRIRDDLIPANDADTTIGGPTAECYPLPSDGCSPRGPELVLVSIPEPASIALIGIGLVAFWVSRRRRTI